MVRYISRLKGKPYGSSVGGRHGRQKWCFIMVEGGFLTEVGPILLVEMACASATSAYSNWRRRVSLPWQSISFARSSFRLPYTEVCPLFFRLAPWACCACFVLYVLIHGCGWSLEGLETNLKHLLVAICCWQHILACSIIYDPLLCWNAALPCTYMYM